MQRSQPKTPAAPKPARKPTAAVQQGRTLQPEIPDAVRRYFESLGVELEPPTPVPAPPRPQRTTVPVSPHPAQITAPPPLPSEPAGKKRVDIRDFEHVARWVPPRHRQQPARAAEATSDELHLWVRDALLLGTVLGPCRSHAKK